MTGRTLSDGKSEAKVSYTFPSLHRDVANEVSDEIKPPKFNRSTSGMIADREYSTNVMGGFKCNNAACPMTGWYSKRVAIVIRRYPGNRYDAEVFNQRCEACEKLGTLSLDKRSYIERVSYRLMKWAGVQMELPEYSSRQGQPHKRELCEGCKRGICQRAAM